VVNTEAQNLNVMRYGDICSSVLHRLKLLQLVKKFPAFYKSLALITAF